MRSIAGMIPDAPAELVSPTAGRQRTSLAERRHRPFAPPSSPWVMGQSWRWLLFAHWSFSPDEIRRVVPDELPLDLFEGRAWLGVTPFVMEGVRPRGLPPAPRLSRFPELNVRTYVMLDGASGIHFFSLDTSNRPTVAGARAVYRLPYFHAQMAARPRAGWVDYAHRRDGARFIARYRPVGPAAYAAPDSLEHWLSERYCAYTVADGDVLRIDIHHRQWEIQPAEARIAANTMADPLGLELRGSPHLMYAARQDILVWPPRRA
jgi:uncharacterized protein YqjF (DUF2071 family)